MTIFGYYTPEVVPPTANHNSPNNDHPSRKTKHPTKPPKPEPAQPQGQPKAEATPESGPERTTPPTGTDTKPQLNEPAAPDQRIQGVVIDARAVAVAPAMFPKVQDTKKRTSTTSKTQPGRSAETRYGFVRNGVARCTISKMFPKALVLAVITCLKAQPMPENKTAAGIQTAGGEGGGTDGQDDQGQSRRQRGRRPKVAAAESDNGRAEAVPGGGGCVQRNRRTRRPAVLVRHGRRAEWRLATAGFSSAAAIVPSYYVCHTIFCMAGHAGRFDHQILDAEFNLRGRWIPGPTS